MTKVVQRISRFRDLTKKLPSLEEFLAKNPEPILLLEPFGESKQASIHTPPEGTDLGLDQTVSNKGIKVQTVFGAGGLGNMVHKNARVAWLVKTDRNPFVGLITVGRARNNDLVLPHPALSKVHAIFHPGDPWQIEDRGSTNGTYVDGVQLPPREKRTLNDGVCLALGDAIMARYFEAESFWQFCNLMSRDD